LSAGGERPWQFRFRRTIKKLDQGGDQGDAGHPHASQAHDEAEFPRADILIDDMKIIFDESHAAV